jgi:hypothetical protein
MVQPESHPVHDKTHTHVDADELMDGSSRAPDDVATLLPEVDTGRAVGGDGENVDLSGGSADAYLSGQDEGLID